MLREALVVLTLAFAAISLHGCGGAVAAFKASGFIKDQCTNDVEKTVKGEKASQMSLVKDKCGDVPEDHQEKCEENGPKMVNMAANATAAEYAAKCIGHVMKEEGRHLAEFNESNTGIPAKVEDYVTKNEEAMKTDFQDYVKYGMDKMVELANKANATSGDWADMQAHASAKFDEAKIAAQEKADEAKAKAEEAAETAQAQASGAKDSLTEHANNAKDSLEEHANSAKDTLEEHANTAQEHLNNATTLFEVHDTDDAKAKTVSNSVALVAGAGMCLVVLGVVYSVSVRLSRESRAQPEDLLVESEDVEIE